MHSEYQQNKFSLSICYAKLSGAFKDFYSNQPAFPISRNQCVEMDLNSNLQSIQRETFPKWNEKGFFFSPHSHKNIMRLVCAENRGLD